MQLTSLSDLRVAISTAPVSWAEYASFARATGRPLPRRPGRPTDPVAGVSATDAAAFARWLSQREGRSYRLPQLSEMSALAMRSQNGLRVWPCQAKRQRSIFPEGSLCLSEWLGCAQTGAGNLLHCMTHPTWLPGKGG
ncbi:MAG: SUMF1/EgtB/PvdO family nonheme iron enzyme, partial [Anaerolineae bacterium]